jgi:putative ABC transport system permease protein
MREWDAEIRARLAGLRLAGPREAELIEELSAHLDDLYQECLARGTMPDEARRTTLAALAEADLAGGLRPLRQARTPAPVALGEEHRGPRRLLSNLGQDLRYGARTLRSRPGFAAAAVLTLALGIGANTAIFSLVNAVLLQSLPVADPARLVHVSYENAVVSYPEYRDLRDHNTVFDGLAAWGGITASLNTGGETDLATGVIVTGNYFDVLGVRPALGRLLAPADDVTPGAHPVMVLGHGFWQRRFNGRPDVVGTEVLLNRHRFTIVGVTAEGFAGAELGTVRNIYVPMMMQAVVRPPRAGYSGEMNPDLLGNSGNRWLRGVGRLKAGVTPERAAAALSLLAATMGPARPAGVPPRPMTAVPVNVGNATVRARLTAVATLLMSVVAAVLLLACANVANLLLSRAASRRREIAVRLALGASRRRLVSQLLTESLLLSVLGGAAGLVLAFWMMSAFRAAPPPPEAVPIAIQATIDLRVLAFTLGLSLLTGVVFGLAPALSASRPNLVPVLKDESFVPDERSRRYNLRSALVVSQVALSLVLLVASGLFLRNLHEVQKVRPGYDVERLMSAQLPINLLRYTRTEGRAFYRTIVERAESLPGVESASLARVPVVGGGGRVNSLHVEGRAGAIDRFRSEGERVNARRRDAVNANIVSPRYFRTLGIPLLAGRDFDERDAPESPLAAIVNVAFTRMHFPERRAEAVLGQRVSADGPEGPWREIVAVVGDAKYGSLTEDPTPVLYLPLAQNHETGMVLYVRTLADPATLAPALRARLQAAEPNLPILELRTVAETVRNSLYVARMAATLLGAFAGLALLLAAIGVYSVTSFKVAQRTHEIGVRMALGARRDDVLALVLGQGMRVVAVGVGLGLILALIAGRSVETFLYGVSGRDTMILAVVPVILAAVALAACLVPARRAVKMDPLAALRQR